MASLAQSPLFVAVPIESSVPCELTQADELLPFVDITTCLSSIFPQLRNGSAPVPSTIPTWVVLPSLWSVSVNLIKPYKPVVGFARSISFEYQPLCNPNP